MAFPPLVHSLSKDQVGETSFFFFLNSHVHPYLAGCMALSTSTQTHKESLSGRRLAQAHCGSDPSSFNPDRLICGEMGKEGGMSGDKESLDWAPRPHCVSCQSVLTFEVLPAGGQCPLRPATPSVLCPCSLTLDAALHCF